MNNYQLPDGTWVTTAIGTGLGEVVAPCREEDHRWEDYATPFPLPAKKSLLMQMQKCSVCSWMRGRYIGNPQR